MHYAAAHLGRCVKGKEHKVKQSGNYVISTAPGSGQAGWRWCNKCQHLWYAAGSQGICPGGGSHTSAGSSEYFVSQDSYVPPNHQAGWKWCSKCMVLWYSGSKAGKCPAGGEHSASGSGAYHIQHHA
eukprot:TRINITY_DN393_c0_g1_i3.p2 TRINITY_DN393_c0_g1~~TRINITY_DN393_c0_g1_i3.p2  ORF type:complete len:127 (-),score=22.38 TRINITY_DN393_c0_g1_i3:65-445(-)